MVLQFMKKEYGQTSIIMCRYIAYSKYKNHFKITNITKFLEKISLKRLNC